MSNYTDMPYNDLRKECSAKGLPATGTKEELIARLEAAPAEKPAAPAPVEEETPAPAPAPAEPVSDNQVEREWRGRAAEMKAHLARQPKVRIFIPIDQGVKPEVADKIPFVVNLNGYRMEIKRGVYVDVPEQVAEVIRERLESEGKIGREHQVNADAAREEALS